MLSLSLSPLLLSTVVAEPSLLDLGALLVQAITTKHYSLLGSVLVLGGVFLARYFGVKLHPALGTPRAGAILAGVGGTASLLVAALAAGQPFSLGLLLSAFSTAMGGAGMWSVAKNAAQKPLPPAEVNAVCTPREIAAGTCKP